MVLGELVAFGVTGVLCETSFLGGWPSVFYMFGENFNIKVVVVVVIVMVVVVIVGVIFVVVVIV